VFDHHFQEEVLRLLRADHNRIVAIEKLLAPHNFTLILERSMAIGNIAAGSTGTFTPQLLLNGQPFVVPAGSTFVPQYTYSSPTADAVLTPSADTTSVVVGIPTGSTDTSVTVGASVIAPDGSTQTATDTVPVTPGSPQAFSLSLSQTA
jgi:hypothetical protein